jgi:transposase
MISIPLAAPRKLCQSRIDRRLRALPYARRGRKSARSTDVGRRVTEVPGVGPVLASAIVASVPDAGAFKTGRSLAAWIGLVPRQNSSGGKEKGNITALSTPV